MSRTAARWLLLLAALAWPAAVRADGRHVAVVLDTSGSMDANDVPRYTVQLSQILSDLLDDKDELNVIRMLDDSSCSAGPTSSIVLALDPADRQGFKRRLDAEIENTTGTYFAASIRTAAALLPEDPAKPRLLLIIADSGGLGSCESELTDALLRLRRNGVTVAAINLGGTAGAFDGNPAFAFTTAALDAQGLIEAVAQVYQKFLGAKTVQTGRVQGAIQVQIAPFVQEAFLVVAADGTLSQIEQGPGNPRAGAVDLGYRGGGRTLGLDRQTRTYRIARLERPAAGRWTFTLPGLAATAGWMLLQDSSVGVRLVSSPEVPKGVDVPLEVEVYDQRTGQRITDPALLPGLRVTLDVDGRQVTFQDGGTGGDRQPGDGILTGTTRFDQAGSKSLPIHLESDLLDRTVNVDARVLDAAWTLAVKTPPRAEVDKPVLLEVELRPVGDPSGLAPPERVDALAGGPPVGLRDDGAEGDRQAGDRIYSRRWTPRRVGATPIDYVPVGGGPVTRAAAPLQVQGRLDLGRPGAVHLGQAQSGTTVEDRLDLAGATVRGEFEVRVSSSFGLDRSALEIDLGDGWVPLGRQPRSFRLSETGPHSWPVRLRVGECPQGTPAGRRFELVLESTAADGRPLRAAVPLEVVVVEDPWLHCWWPVLAAGAGLLVAGVLLHGWWSPSRFAPRLGVVLSPEEDVNEGFFHPIRAQRGSRSGFYRDARVFIRQDYRLSGHARDAVARLRADEKLVRIQPVHGSVLWRQTADGTWEQVPQEESTARFGNLYRNETGNLFFEIRNA
jgi:VWA domain-containing protein